MKLDIHQWKNSSTEKVSSRIFYPMVIVSVVVFALFWFVGHDRPYDENPNFNAPLFTDIFLFLSYLLIAATIGFGIWSVVRTMKLRGKGEAYNNNIPVKKIGYSIGIGALLLMVLSFLVGSSREMTINGVKYGDWFWLKVSDMFIYTSLILLLVAVGAVIYGATKYIRK
ncbi:MAG: hypothetical protein I3J02_10740 [Prevotella sp.]|nr:hypothetical protein [Prevotella sp.]